jgi:cysteine desulfurase/selenocysteine lyase
VLNIRKKFPIFAARTPLSYLDSAATAQKPDIVIEAMNNFYSSAYGNVHRGVYALAEHATEQYEAVRIEVAKFLDARNANEIVFTRGTTESINLIAATWGRQNIKAGDEVVITALEHHANLLPWQVLCQQVGAILRVIPVSDDGLLDMQAAEQLIGSKTKLVACVHSSNFLGTRIDVGALAHMAHAVGAKVLVDAAQSVVHESVSVQELHCDFLVFSGHKLYGPTGVGVLYGREELLAEMPPYQVGGSMVYEADYQTARWMQSPRKFEAGTPPIAGVIGLGAAISFVNSLDRKQVAAHETKLCAQLITELQSISKIRLLGPIAELKAQGHLASFVVEGIHPHDVAAYLDQFGICVRAGHHCAQPLAKRLKLDAAVRISFACYNTSEEVEQVCTALRDLCQS